MLGRIRTYFSRIQVYIRKYLHDQFNLGQLPFIPGHMACISFFPQEILFIYAIDKEGKFLIQRCESYSYTEKNDLPAILSSIVKKYGLKNTDTALILQSNDYQLLAIDTLPVTPAEFQSAVRWKIKDLIQLPVNDIVIDSFLMPGKNNQNKTMVTVAQASKLVAMKDEINSCNLSLQSISIPELSLRNIAVLYDKSGQSTALLYLQDNVTYLLIIYEKQLYVSRVLKFGWNGNDNDSINLERLSSEILRSVDYYQSIWNRTGAIRFILSSVKPISVDAIQILIQRINAPVEKINLKDIIHLTEEMNAEKQSKFLLLIGEILRKNNQYPQDINLYPLLPHESGIFLSKQPIKYAYGIFFLFLVMINMVILWRIHNVSSEYDQLNQDISIKKQELSLLTASYPINNLDDLKKSIKQLQQQNILQTKFIDLVSPFAEFSSYLLGLSYAISPGVWLTEISFNRGEIKIALRGYAEQLELLENFYNKLSKQSEFSSLTFKLNESNQTTYPFRFYMTAKEVNKYD